MKIQQGTNFHVNMWSLDIYSVTCTSLLWKSENYLFLNCFTFCYLIALFLEWVLLIVEGCKFSCNLLNPHSLVSCRKWSYYQSYQISLFLFSPWLLSVTISGSGENYQLKRWITFIQKFSLNREKIYKYLVCL